MAFSTPLLVTLLAKVPPLPKLIAIVPDGPVVTALLPAIEPMLPLPIRSVPTLTFVGPLFVLGAIAFIVPLSVTLLPKVSPLAKLIANVPAVPVVTALLPAIDAPVVLPSPICNAPNVIVVGPE